MKISSLSTQFEIKDLDEAEGTFEGHASIFNIKDLHDDIVLPGAFKKSLKKRPAKKVKLLRGHNGNNLIGQFTEMHEDDKGLFVKGKLLMQIQAAAETFLLLKEGILDSLSIGFQTIVDEFDSKTGIRKLIELELFEVSLVTFPAQPSALVTGVKQATPGELTNKRELERALCDAGFSISTSKYICAGWTPPALRNVEGGSDLVDRIRRLTHSMNPNQE